MSRSLFIAELGREVQTRAARKLGYLVNPTTIRLDRNFSCSVSTLCSLTSGTQDTQSPPPEEGHLSSLGGSSLMPLPPGYVRPFSSMFPP